MNPETRLLSPLEELEDEIALLSSQIDAATHRLLTLIRKFDELEGYSEYGLLSTASWLGWRCGISDGAAREKVRVAKALAELPLIDEEMSKGGLSFSKVRAMTRVANADNEQALIDIAKSATASQLEKICRGVKKTTGPLFPPEEPPDERRFVSCRSDDDGMIRISARLHPDEAAIVMKAIDKAIEQQVEENRKQEREVSHKDVSAETRPEEKLANKTLPKVTRADALVHVAQGFLSGQEGNATSADRYQVLFHLQPDVLSGQYGLKFEDGSSMPDKTLQRIACDCSMVPVVTSEKGEVLDVGRKTRSIPPSIRRALEVRDGCCQFPGCGQRKWLSAHHIENWLYGGKTKLSNLVLLCSRHHQCVHEEGFTCELSEDGKPTFYNPKGVKIPASVPASEVIHDPIDVWTQMLLKKGVSLHGKSNLFPYEPRPDYNMAVACAS